MTETEKKTEEIAKKISIQRTGSDAMWELFLTEAYDQVFKLGKHKKNV